MRELTIITALSRPVNLREMADSIRVVGQSLFVTWIVVPDSRSIDAGVVKSLTGRHYPNALVVTGVAGDVSGAPQKNAGLKLVSGRGWVYFLDDDNLIHPSMVPAMLGEPTDAILCFPQVDYNGKPLRGECVPEWSKIDLGQFVVPAAIAPEAVFPADNYSSDWEYLSAMIEGNGTPYRWVKEGVSWYNALRI